MLRPRGRPWYDVETANASFGQGVSVTAVQLAMGMAAIANGGRLLEPVLVRKVTDSRGETLREGVTRVRREAVPPRIARMVTEMLVAVTEQGGTGTEAHVPGFRVAGKTATAQKADPATGKYSSDKYTASFMGFVPAERPRLVIAVVLDEPVIGHYGGDLAGPVFRRTAEAALRYLGVTPTSAPSKLPHVTRDGDPADQVLSAMKGAAAASVNAKAAGALADAHEGAAESAGAEDPASPEQAGQDPAAPILPPGAPRVSVPEVKGLAARDAVKAVTGAGLVPVIEGSGRIVRQYPSAGAAAVKGSSVRLVFEPAS